MLSAQPPRPLSLVFGDRSGVYWMPHIRIFPCGEEFPSPDALVTWLMTALRARGGRYLLRSADAVADLAPGSIVLFRHGDVIVAEGLVRDYAREAGTDRSLTGDHVSHGARVEFVPDALRVFAPPLPVAELQRLIGTAPDISVARTYFIVRDWGVYPKILAAHIGRAGRFV